KETGCYAQARYVGGGDAEIYFDRPYWETVTRVSKLWSDATELPEEIQTLWGTVIRGPTSGDDARWCDATLTLLAVADEASEGIGFVAESGSPPFVSYYIEQYVQTAARDLAGSANALKATDLPFLPESLCRLVPPTAACVQPKTTTPKVGCTLRSLS